MTGTPTPTPTPTTTDTGVRRAYVVTLVVAAVVLIGALVFMLTSLSDRDDAADERRDETQQLHAQRLALQDAKDQRVAARSAAAATLRAFGPVITSEQQLADLLDQGVDAARTTQGVGASESPAIGEYNAAIAHANDLADQYNTTLQSIRDQLKAVATSIAS